MSHVVNCKKETGGNLLIFSCPSFRDLSFRCQQLSKVSPELLESEHLKGDLNSDGSVDLRDAVLALRVLAGIITDEDASANADVNGDGKIGIGEVLYILRNVLE